LPSFPYTPGALALTGGEFFPEPIRFTYTPGALSLTGGSFTAGPNLSSNLSADIAAILDNLFASEAIVDKEGRPTRRFQQIWENTINGIKDILTSQSLSITELQAIYAGINTAQATATTAVQSAQDTERRRGHEGSYTSPVGVLSAASDGTITIVAHDRYYLDQSAPVAVNSGTVSGFAPGDSVTVYYVDAARAGGAVNYQGTTSAVAQTGDTLVVGQVAVPAVGQPSTPGTSPSAPGWTFPDGYDPGAAYLA
jgi:hypothetical protein